jgi:hypothetical protein
MAAEELLAVRLQLLKRKLDELEAQAATFAPAVHGHTIPQVAGLPEALDAKAPTAHGHSIADVEGLQAALDAAGSGGGASDFTLCTLFKPAATAWVTNAWNNTAFGTQAQVAGRAVLSPFLSSHDLTIDQVAVSVSTAVAGALFKVVIHAADADGRPGAVLAESPTLDAATTGTKTVALAASLSLSKGTLYWIGVRSSSTATLRCLNVGASPQLTASTAATPVGTTTIIRAGEVFANAAADWTFANSQLSNALAPLVLMRVA